MKNDKIGLLLLNLGTPKKPNHWAVRNYLFEFLKDPRVLSIPAFFRYLLLFLIILPFRSFKSANAYKKVWRSEGSPLLFHSLQLTEKVRENLKEKNILVTLGMRYGSPSIKSALVPLLQNKIDKLIILPLFPQYSSAASGSAIQKTIEELKDTWNMPSVEIISSFHNHECFIQAQANEIENLWKTGEYDFILFSYHGLPLEHLQRNEHYATPCEITAKCCETLTESNKTCYRRQCVETTKLLVEQLGIPANKHTISFQSRLGRAVWVLPNTEVVLNELAKKGHKKLLVACPSFVADCLETLEEISMRAEEQWLEQGGQKLTLVPCVNSSHEWANAVVKIAGLG
jgi:protoporphyrin/coproporphyrin ferrochelatase